MKSQSMKRLRPKTAYAKGMSSRKRKKKSKGLKGRAKSAKQLKMTDRDLRRPSETLDYGEFDTAQEEDDFIPQSKKNIKHYPKYYGRFPERPIKGYVKFFQKTKRKEMQFGTPNYDPLGKQFIKSLAAINPHNSRHKPIRGFKMSKIPPRNGIFDQDADHPDYHPNFEVVKKRINRGVLSFETMEARKGMEYQSQTKNEAYYDYDFYKSTNRSQKIRRTRMVDLDKNLPKELNPESGMPSFLQTRRPISAQAQLMIDLNNMTLKEKRNLIRKKRRKLLTAEGRKTPIKVK